MPNLSIESKPNINVPLSVVVLDHQPNDITERLNNIFRSTMGVDLSTTPPVPLFWGEKTQRLLKTGYEVTNPIAQRAVHFFCNLGYQFPDCSSLEAITRQIISSGEFIPEKIKRVVNHFQDRSRRNGGALYLNLTQQ